MRLLEGAAALPAGLGPTAVAIGKFDGVHLGHRAVIDRLVALATERSLAPVVVTFDRHPLSLLRPEACPDALVSNAQRAELLAGTELAATVVLEFTRELSSLPAERFVEEVLVRSLDARLVLAGADFRFGHRGAGDVPLLRELGERFGFEVVLLDDVRSGETRVSSTRVRERLAAGDVRAAAEMLGRRPRVRSTVVPGDRVGRELGFPTANLDPAMEGFLPADGVYAAWAHVPAGRFGTAVSIGNNPTFDGIPDRRTEAHLLDFAGDLYGGPIELEFVDRIRSMQRFESVEALTVALADDVERIRAILAAEPDAAVAPAGDAPES